MQLIEIKGKEETMPLTGRPVRSHRIIFISLWIHLFLFVPLTAGMSMAEESINIRLTALLPQAEIFTPLSEVAAAESIDALAPVAAEYDLLGAFDEADSKYSRQDCEVRFEGAGRDDLLISCRQGGYITFPLAAEPNAAYKVRLAHKGGRMGGFSMAVSEWAGTRRLRGRTIYDLGKTKGSHQISFITMASTDRIEVALKQPNHGGRLQVEDLAVERLDLSREAELRLLKGDSRRDADLRDDPGIAKRGHLLPLPHPELSVPPQVHNYTIRDFLFAPAPTVIHFPLRLPEEARLSFFYGLAKESAVGDSVRFRLNLTDESGRQEVLFDEVVTYDGLPEHLNPQYARLDLSAHAGRDVRLSFETRSLAPGHRAYALWGSPEIHRARQMGDRPNVILIAVDTLRADYLSGYGSKYVSTPAMDTLAGDGVRFEQAIAQSNWTVPSFYALFSGSSAHDLGEFPDERPEAMLAERFQEAGWATGAILYKPALYDRGYARGFDSFFNVPRWVVRGDQNIDRALEWLRRNRDRRFFLFLHLDDPHQPFCQPMEFVGAEAQKGLAQNNLSLPLNVYDRDIATIDPVNPKAVVPKNRYCASCKDQGVLKPPLKELARTLYADSTMYADHEIGRFIAALKREGLYDDAVIALMADHGETLWEHKEQYAHAGPNLYDELIHVPLIVKPPKNEDFAKGESIPAQVRLYDLRPTLLELAGIPVDPVLSDAQTLLPALYPNGASHFKDRPAFSGNTAEGMLALRHQGWKYIRNYPVGVGRYLMQEELYNLSNDPDEKDNLLDRNPAILADMQQAMDELLVTGLLGPTVVVTGGDSITGSYRVTLEWSNSARPSGFNFLKARQIGIYGGKEWDFTGLEPRPLLLLAPFQTTAQKVKITFESLDDAFETREYEIESKDFVPYQPGLMDELLQQREVSVQVIAGLPRQRMSHSHSSATDDQLIEVLRQLGYLQ